VSGELSQCTAIKIGHRDLVSAATLPVACRSSLAASLAAEVEVEERLAFILISTADTELCPTQYLINQLVCSSS
jgi:hypothetical protein